MLLQQQRRIFLLLLSITLWFTPVYAVDKVPPETTNIDTTTISPEQLLHSKLLLTALRLDFYNARCRGQSIAKHFNQVNRLYITKYSLTANNYIKTYINADVRKEKAQQEIAFKKDLSKIGGCAKAKNEGWVKSLRDAYNKQYLQAEQSSWFPEEI